MPELIWKSINREYITGFNLFLGKYAVGSVYFDGTVARGSENRYATTCSLPGIKNNLGHFKTEEEAKERVEYAVNYWLNNALGEKE
jgi:hypothetical protein